jgi:hypothetical protein
VTPSVRAARQRARRRRLRVAVRTGAVRVSPTPGPGPGPGIVLAVTSIRAARSLGVDRPAAEAGDTGGRTT